MIITKVSTFFDQTKLFGIVILNWINWSIQNHLIPIPNKIICIVFYIISIMCEFAYVERKTILNLNIRHMYVEWIKLLTYRPF